MHLRVCIDVENEEVTAAAVAAVAAMSPECGLWMVVVVDEEESCFTVEKLGLCVDTERWSYLS